MAVVGCLGRDRTDSRFGVGMTSVCASRRGRPALEAGVRVVRLSQREKRRLPFRDWR